MPSNKDSNSTLITTLAVAQTLATITDAGNYQITVQPSPLVADEILLIEVYNKILTGDTTTDNLYDSGVYASHNSDTAFSIPVSTVFETVLQITQLNGTKRTFDWAVVDMS